VRRRLVQGGQVGAARKYETFDRLDVYCQDDRVVKYSYEVVR
jgi:hypothetical protein